MNMTTKMAHSNPTTAPPMTAIRVTKETIDYYALIIVYECMRNWALLLTSQDAGLRKETCRAILLAHDDDIPAAAGPVLADLCVCGLAVYIGVGVQFVDVGAAAAATRCKNSI